MVSHLEVLLKVGFRWDPRIGFAKKIPGDADAFGQSPHSEDLCSRYQSLKIITRGMWITLPKSPTVRV